jgi:hypothetical protein
MNIIWHHFWSIKTKNYLTNPLTNQFFEKNPKELDETKKTFNLKKY